MNNEIKTTGGVYTKDAHDIVIHNICAVFGCDENEIKELRPIQAGMTNIVLTFRLNGGKYVYRHPGLGSEVLVNRGRETIMQAVVAQAGIDKSLIAMDVENGWRISKYIDHRDFDYHNLNDMVRAMMLFQRLHSVPSRVRWNFDVIRKAEEIRAQIPEKEYGSFEDFEGIRDRCYRLNSYTMKDNIKKCYIHGDARDVNFLINKEEIYLIDWEYGGYGDPGFDLGSYICGGEHSIEDIEKILFTYFRRRPTLTQKRHFYAYIALTGWFYLHWTMLKESKGQMVGHNKKLWHYYAMEYSKLALEMYEGDDRK